MSIILPSPFVNVVKEMRTSIKMSFITPIIEFLLTIRNMS